MNNFDAAFRAKNKAASDFRARLNAGGARVVGDGPRSRLPSVGIFNADGSPHPMNDLRARAAQVAPPVIEPVAGPAAVSQPGAYGAQPGTTLGSRVAMPPPQPVAPTRIPVTGAGGVASGSGKTYWPGTGATPSVPPAPAAPATSAVEAKPSLLNRAASTIERGIQPPDWKALGSKAASGAKGLAGGALRNINSLSGGITAANDFDAIRSAENSSPALRIAAGAETLGNVAGNALIDRFVGPAGVIIPGIAGAVNGMLLNGRPVSAAAKGLSKVIGLGTGEDRTALEMMRDENGAPRGADPLSSIYMMKPKGPAEAGKAAEAERTQPAALSTDLQRVKDTTFDPNNNPFIRRASPEVELARQQANFASTADGGNGLGAAVEAAFHAQRGKFSNGAKAFADEDTRALFNTNQALQGTGIQANKQANGVTEFSGNNVSGMGGKLYRAADGSVTNDWSKTKDYADQIQRNAKDQDRLAELTRGAAMSGDKEAVARLTAGDGRLQAIAEKAATERDLRQAVKGGSAKAAQILATMENTGADNAFKAQELDLRRSAMVGAQEDRDLDRALRRDALTEKSAAAVRAAEKDAREVKKDEMATLDKHIEQYATVDGKLNPEKLARMRGVAASFQPSPGQSPEEFRRDQASLISLASKLDGMQAFYDKMFSQAGMGGTSIRKWKVNNGWRGGFTTDDGDHISTGQYNKLTDDEKRIFKAIHLDGGK